MSEEYSSELSPVELLPPEILTKAISDGRRLGLQLAFLDGGGAALKKAGAWWCAPRRMWLTEAVDSVRAQRWLVSALGEIPFTFDVASAFAVLRQSESAAESTYFTQVLDVQIFPLRGGGLAVSSIYDAYVVRAMKSLGGRFHSTAQAWQLRANVDRVLEALRSIAGVASEFVFCHDTEVVLETLTAPPKSLVPITVPAASPPGGGGVGVAEDSNEGTGFLTTISEVSQRLAIDRELLARHCAGAGLRDYQETGVEHLVAQTGACLADDMGLGKSRQTVVALAFVARMEDDGVTPASKPGRILLICPASLRINWEREIRAVYPDAKVGMVGEDRLSTLYGCEWVIANYERLGGLVKETGLTFRAVAGDEAHCLKEHDSGRTRNAFILSARIARRFVITGTPLLNKEIELHTLLRLTGHRLGLMPLKEFRKDYAGGLVQREALATALRGWMLRRSKGVLRELGEKTRHVQWISPPEGMKPYQDLLADVSLTVMPKLVKLRQCLEGMKVDFLLDTIGSMSEGDKIIVFVEYMATVDILSSALARLGVKAATLVGADSTTKRQRAVDMFQTDPGCTVFITTTAAGGVGITLTAANWVVLTTLPWSPSLMRQAEDRAYRLGQKRNVKVLVPLIPNTIDVQIWDLLASKTQLEQDVIEASVVKQLH